MLNYAAVGSTGTGATLSINPSTAYSLKLRNYANSTDIVVDVSGYYVKPLAATIAADGTLYAGSSRAVSSTRSAAGVYTVTFDRDIEQCTASATAYLLTYYASVDTYSSSNPNTATVRVMNNAGTLVDQYVYVTMTC